MADFYNSIPLKRMARTVADCLGVAAPEGAADGIAWLTRIARQRAGGNVRRAVLYHADAVPMYVYQKYTYLFESIFEHVQMCVPFLSTVESVTPVAHASMYTGLTPEEHGIKTYVRPRLQCDTLYDALIRQGKKPAIIAQTDSSFLHIFAGRAMPYREVKNAAEAIDQARALMDGADYDVLSIHVFEYDDAAHAHGPESPEALAAIEREARRFDELAREIKARFAPEETLIGYMPDHGQHLLPNGRGSHGSTLPEDMNVMHFYGVI